MEVMDPRSFEALDPPVDFDQVVLLPDISWEQYVALNDAAGQLPRMAYLDGVLEVMTTSTRHEISKKLLARLVEAYAEEAGIPLNGSGHATQRDEKRKAAAEPDETYSIGKIGKHSDLVLEVVYTSGGLHKLEIYRRLGAREVWFWINGRISVYVLVDGQYEERATSIALPTIDLRELERIVALADDDQTAAVRAYRQRLRARS
jgi:Uma2 family endonuclease